MVIIAFAAFKLAANKKKINEKSQPPKIGNVQIPVTTVSVKEDVVEAGLCALAALPQKKKIAKTKRGRAFIRD